MLTKCVRWSLSISLGVCLILCGCRGKSPDTADGKSSPATTSSATTSSATISPIAGDSTPPPPPKPVSHSLRPDDPDAIAIPTGDVMEIVAFINDMAGRGPTGDTLDEQNESLARMMDARIRAAEQLIADNEAEDSYQVVAAESKLESLRILSLIAQEGAPEATQDYLNILSKSENTDIRQIGRIGTIMSHVDQIRDDPNASPDSVVDGITKLFDSVGPNIRLYYAVNEISRIFTEAGRTAPAAAVLAIAVEKSNDVADEQITEIAASMAEKLKRLQTEVRLSEVAAADGTIDSQDVLAVIKQLLESAAADEAMLSTLLPVARRLETTDRDAARDVYQQVKTAFADGDQAVSARANQEVNFAEKRLGLIGTKLRLTGKNAAGEDFDSSIGDGKVVLAFFWATESSESFAEMTTVKEIYKAHQEDGLCVVGVNLDTDANLLEQSRALKVLPWTNLVDTQSHPNPNAELCGVNQLPYLVLANRRGEVVATHTEVAGLTSQIEKLLDAKVASNTPISSQSPAASEKEGKTNTEQTDAANTDIEKSNADALNTQDVETKEANAEKGNTEKIEKVEGEIEGISEANPYAPPAGLSTVELATFIMEMQDKPRSIQYRDGFRDGVIQAADQVLAAETSSKYRAIAALAKFDYLHRDACLGDEDADKMLMASVQSLVDDEQQDIAKNVAFFNMERRALTTDLPLEQVPERIEELTKYLGESRAELAARHLRMASATVELINRLEDGDTREKHFVELGDILAESKSKQVARYGRRLSRKTATVTESELIGTELTLTGTTVEGVGFDLNDYRGTVVLIDFWATWCAPCRAMFPKLETLYEKNSEKSFEIVGVSIDQDIEALESYLDDHPAAWPQLAGEANSESADRLGVRNFPTLILVDKAGKVVASGNRLKNIEPKLNELLK